MKSNFFEYVLNRNMKKFHSLKIGLIFTCDVIEKIGRKNNHNEIKVVALLSYAVYAHVTRYAMSLKIGRLKLLFYRNLIFRFVKS